MERDAAYLNWRYCDPRAGAFRITGAFDREALLGYVVTKIEGSRGYIADLLALPGRTDIARSLVEEALRSFRESNVAAVRCGMTRRHPYYRLLRRYGFLDSRRSFTWHVASGEPLDDSELLTFMIVGP